MDANFNNSQLIKLGQQQQTHVKPKDVKIFKFMVDDKSAISIQVTAAEDDSIKTYISLSEDSSKAFYIITGSGSVKISKDSEFMKTE